MWDQLTRPLICHPGVGAGDKNTLHGYLIDEAEHLKVCTLKPRVCLLPRYEPLEVPHRSAAWPERQEGVLCVVGPGQVIRLTLGRGGAAPGGLAESPTPAAGSVEAALGRRRQQRADEERDKRPEGGGGCGFARHARNVLGPLRPRGCVLPPRIAHCSVGKCVRALERSEGGEQALDGQVRHFPRSGRAWSLIFGNWDEPSRESRLIGRAAVYV